MPYTSMSSKVSALNEIPDEQLACRAGRHDWPVLVPGKPVPKNFKSEPVERNGVYLVTETCKRCGKQKIWLTRPRGIYDTGFRRYIDPLNWKKLPRDLEISKTDCASEVFRRMLPQILASSG